jgi:hypothetical protein
MQQARLGPRTGVVVTAVTLAAIGAVTLVPGSEKGTEPPLACIICGEQGLADALVNVILFLPLGGGLALGEVRLRRALIAGALISALVEFAQLLIPGRDPSVGDLLSNTVGTGIGYAATWLAPVLARLDEGAAAKLSIAAALDVLLAVLLTGWFLQPSFPHGEYWGHWTPMFGHLEWYRGRVSSARIAGREVPPRRIEHSEWVRLALLRGGPIEVGFSGGPEVPGLASLFNVSDERLREIVLIGPDRQDLVFRYRTRSTAWGLDQPDLRVPGGWSARPGELAAVRAWSPARGEWCLASGRAHHCGLGFTVGSGWTLLFYAEAFPAWLRALLSAGWAAAVTFPVGFFLRQRGEGVAAVTVAVLGFAVLPGVVALQPTRGVEWLGIAFGLSVGCLAARALRGSAVLTRACSASSGY